MTRPSRRTRSTCRPARRSWIGARSERGTSSVVVRRRVRSHFPRVVVAVLLVPEEPPAVVEQLRHLGTEDAAGGRVAVRDVDTGDFVVALVLEAVADRAEHVVERGGLVAAQGEETDRLD